MKKAAQVEKWANGELWRRGFIKQKTKLGHRTTDVTNQK